MKYLPGLLIIFAFSGLQFIQGQQGKVMPPGKLHQIEGTDYQVKIPDVFIKSKAHKDEFVYKEKGSVVRFAYLKDIPASRFLDSMTTRYFEAQDLHEVTEANMGEITNFRGKFTINKVPYIRSFFVIPYKGSTILGISNYPEKLEPELGGHFKNMYKHSGND